MTQNTNQTTVSRFFFSRIFILDFGVVLSSAIYPFTCRGRFIGFFFFRFVCQVDFGLCSFFFQHFI